MIDLPAELSGNIIKKKPTRKRRLRIFYW